MKQNRKPLSVNLVKKHPLQLLMVALFAVCMIFVPKFATMGNLVNMLIQVSFNAIVATGATYVILVGDTDLSSGAVGGLAGMMVGYLVLNMPGISKLGAVGMILLVSLVIGPIVGAVTGYAITRFSIPPMIATLAMQRICRGLAYIMNDGAPYFGLSDHFKLLGVGKIGPVPIIVVIMLVVLLLGDLFLKKTVIGRHIYAVGSNMEVAKLGGISVMKTKVIAHVIASSLAAFTGCLYASKLLSGQPQACDGYELTAMASVAIGGTSMRGGRGGVSNTILGIIVFGMLNNSMNLLGISSYWQMVITGIIIAVSVIADGILNKE